jgi:ABC-type sugar transport system ATPase subunit
MSYELSRLHKQLGSTMIYVTHDQVEAMTMGDRIAVLAPLKQAGASNLMQFGTPDEVYHRPANLFVAKFIGSPPMNFFEARVVDGKVMIGNVELDLPTSQSTVSEMTVGIRPEHIQINAQAGCIVEGTLESIENLGHEKLFFFTTSIGRIITRAGSDVVNDALGTKFKLGLPWEKMHFFDVGDGKRM